MCIQWKKKKSSVGVVAIFTQKLKNVKITYKEMASNIKSEILK